MDGLRLGQIRALSREAAAKRASYTFMLAQDFLPGPMTKGVDYGAHNSSPCDCGGSSFLQGRCRRWNVTVGNRRGVMRIIHQRTL